MQQALLLAGAFLLMAACGPFDAAGDRDLTWIELSTNDGWFVMVEADGSGYLAYGPFSGQRVRFPTATFDFRELRSSIRACSATYAGRHALVSRIFSAGTREIEQYYCQDSLLGQRWLGAAFRGLPATPAQPTHYRRLCRRWRAQPPLDLALRGAGELVFGAE